MALRFAAPAPPPADLTALAELGGAVSDPVLLADGTLEVTWANAAAGRLFECAPEALVGRRLDELVPAVAREAFRAAARDGDSFVLDGEQAASHPLAGRRCALRRAGDGVAVVVAPDLAPSISTIVRQLNQTLEVERIVHLVAQHAVELLGARRAAVFILDGDTLEVAGRSGSVSVEPGARLPIGATFGGVAIRALRPVRIADVRAAADRWPVIAADAAGDARPCVIAAPLVIGGRPVGVVCVAGRDDADFDAADERLLGTLADHAAIAVENARLYSAAARTARHASILAETGREIARHVSPRELYTGVARVAVHALRVDGVCVYLADMDTHRVEVAHREGTLAGAESGLLTHGFWEGPAGRAARSGSPCFLREAGAGATPDGCAVPGCAHGAGALAILPLVVEGHARGVLALHYTRPQPFDEPERRLLGDFATQVAIGMRNGSLIAALERRAARLAALARAQQDIPRATLSEVYAELHAAVAAVVDAPCFALLTMDDDGGELVPRHVVVDGRAAAPGGLPARATALAAEAVRTERPVFEYPPVWSWSAAAAPEPGREWRPAASGLAVPVRHGGRVLGALHVQSHASGAYGPGEADLLAIVAGHAGAAVELARLFALQQRQSVLSEASAEIARLALGDDDLPTVASELLAVVERIVPAHTLVLSAITAPDVVEYVAATGIGAALTGLKVPLGESLLQKLEAGRELVVHDVRAIVAPHLRGAVPDVTAIFVPLVARQRVMGMLAAGTPRGQPLPEAHVAELRKLAASVALAVDALLLTEEERRRTARERELAAALATMDQPVLVLDPDGRVRDANRAAEREYGYPLAELTQLHVSLLAPGDGRVTPAWGIAVPSDAPPRQIGRRASGTVRVAEDVHRRRDGSEFPVSVTRGTIRDEQGRAVGHVLGVRNLTEERRVTEQLRQHEKLAALGSLVAGVAHELNNPLTGISAFSQLLLEEGLGAEQTEAVQLIKREADRAVGVIRDLLLFARKTGAELGEVDVNALLQLAVRLRTYSLRAERIEVVLDLDPSEPCAVGDEQRLQQVFLNLIVNAEHAMADRDERRLTLRTRRTGAHLVVEVRDTGSGMDEETLAHVFEPFFTTKPAGTGTGLGLSVSYGIVQAHGGAITADSAPGRGTTFRITLPLAHPAELLEAACP